MGGWYTLGLMLGAGVGLGAIAAGLLAGSSLVSAAATAVAIVAGLVVGLAAFDWPEAILGGVGGAIGSLSAAVVVAGARRRGGTRGGIAVLVGAAGLVIAALALIPVVGYVEAVAAPILAGRLRRQRGERYAGLRSLAK